MPRHTRSRPAGPASVIVLAVAVALLAATSCSSGDPTPPPSRGPTTAPSSGPPTPSPSPLDPLEVYAAIEEQIAAIRELEPKATLTPEILDVTQLEKYLRELYDRETSRELLEEGQRLFVALGLLEPDASLRDEQLALLGGQVIGYYSPDDDALYVVRRTGALGPTERATFAHEYVHALQDQHFDLEAIGIDDATNSDRALARRALVEGDATIAQTQWLLEHLTREELLQLTVDASDPEALAVLARAPAVLRELSMFPYGTGGAFVGALQAGGAWAGVDAAYADLPDSTEQLIHPERYLERDEPSEVEIDVTALVAGGWTIVTDDVLGEFMVDLWLREGGVKAAVAREAAAGWDGDQVVLADGPAGRSALVLRAVWDTPADATEFVSAARDALEGYGIDGDVLRRPGSAEVMVITGSRLARTQVQELLGP